MARSALVTSKLPLPDHAEAVPHAQSCQGAADELGDPHQDLSTNANTRAGLPVPPTIGNGATTRIGAGLRQRRDVLQQGQPVLVGAEQVVVRGEGGVEAARLAGVDADRLDPEPGDGTLGEPLRRGRGRAGGVRAVCVGVRERHRVGGTRAPPGAQDQPRPVGDGSLHGLPRVEVLRLEQEVRVVCDLLGQVEDHSGPDQPARRDVGDAGAVAAGDPVDRRVEVGAGVFAGVQVVPAPHRAGVVEVGDRFQ